MKLSAVVGFLAIVACGGVIPNNRQFNDDDFLLPFECGKTEFTTQGNNFFYSHHGDSAYAFDFDLESDTPILAMKAGTVVFVDLPTRPGDPCYNGGPESCSEASNTITVDHADGTNTYYGHLNNAIVYAGADVEHGDIIGLSGDTGWSSGPHVHVQRQEDCGESRCASIPMEFADFGGVPQTGDWATSGNGCDFKSDWLTGGP